MTTFLIIAIVLLYLGWRGLCRIMLRRSQLIHAAQLRAIAKWEAENTGKPREQWSPLP